MKFSRYNVDCNSFITSTMETERFELLTPCLGWITSFLRKSSREFFTVELSIDNSIFLVAMRFWETPVLIPNTMVKT